MLTLNKVYLEFFSLFALRNYCDENFRGQCFFGGDESNYEI